MKVQWPLPCSTHQPSYAYFTSPLQQRLGPYQLENGRPTVLSKAIWAAYQKTRYLGGLNIIARFAVLVWSSIVGWAF